MAGWGDERWRIDAFALAQAGEPGGALCRARQPYSASWGTDPGPEACA